MVTLASTIAGAQSFINSYTQMRFKVDGVQGPMTNHALARVPDELKSLFENIGISINQTDFPEGFNDMSRYGKTLEEEKAREIASAFIKVSRDMDVPARWLLSFARIESRFNPTATNGSSRGLFQFQKGAWNDASRLVRLKSYDTHWSDPLESTKAAAAYMLINIGQLSKLGLDARREPRWLYLAHQQGVAGLVDLKLASERKRYKGLVSAAKMLANPTPGYSKTTIASEFYRNWMSYLKNYF
jgi:hypothetical protein